MNSTKLSAFCDKVLEVGWLLAVIITPLFFNVYSSRVFEPDKLTTLRTVALIMAAVWLVKWIEERASGQRGIGITWRMPLVLPALFTVVVYLLSTLLSVTPRVSLFGSYQRLQGTYTTLAYIVIFFIILLELRTRAQLDRLITVVILNSLPIALYGFLQHNRLDPLPWGGDVTYRIASNMGNAIFVAAYMVMAALVTLSRIVDAFRAILADEEASTADVLRAAAYIFIFLIQVIAVWYSQSRGPMMGLLFGLAVWAFLGLLALQRAARQSQPLQPLGLLKDLGRGLAFGLGSLAAAGAMAAIAYFVGKAVTAPGSSTPEWAAMIGAVLALLGAWVAFIANHWGWRWLWASALVIAVLFSAGFLVINLVEPVRNWSQQQPALGRLDDVLQPEGGTGKVRALIWEGALDLILPHPPIEYPPTQAHPQGRTDLPYGLRALVGYGPESMYVAYNRFYPPLLGHFESRTASPDRSHNETMDSLVITGLLGFVAYLWIFGSVFYFGLRWLGFLPDGWRRTLFFVLLAAGAVIAVVAVIPTLGPHFFCLAIPIGMAGGLLIYLAVYGFSVYWEPQAVTGAHPYFILLVGIVSAVVAHLVEINFGIAIASTRTTFWAYAGALVVAGLGLVREQEETRQQEAEGKQQDAGNKKRKKRRKVAASPARSTTLPAWLGPTLAVAIVGGFVLGTLAFDFVTNAEHFSQPSTIVWRALTIVPGKTQETCLARWDAVRGECRSYGVLLIVFGLTWVMGVVVFMSQMVKNGAFREHKGDWVLATVLYLSVSLAVGLGFALVIASSQASLITHPPETLEGLGSRVANQLVLYYWFIVCALVVGGVVLFLGVRQQPRQSASPWGVGALLVLAILAGFVAVTTNLRPIQADIVFKQGESYDQSAQWPMAIGLYQQAIKLASHEDFYYLYLGRAYLEYARPMEDPNVRDNVMAMTEQTLSQARETNPLNTDHSANLARMYRTWADFASDPEVRQSRLQQSSDNYALATMLSPHHAILWNEWATLFYLYIGDVVRAQETISRSLELDPDYDQSWLIQADIYASQNLITDSVRAYERALEINPQLAEVWLRLGQIRLNQGQLEDAITDYEKALELSPGYVQGWRELGVAYAQSSRLEEAAAALQHALDLAPEGSDAWDTHRMLAIIYSQLGQPDVALSHAQTALQLAPSDQQPAIQQLIAQLTGGAQP